MLKKDIVQNKVFVLYRISDNGYQKIKFEHATKMYCLNNFLKHFPAEQVSLFIDKTNLKSETHSAIKELDKKIPFHNLIWHEAGSSAGSWGWTLQSALAIYHDHDIIYFVEDDYLHLSGSENAIREGLEIADYVSLYDHNDKYIPASQGGNAFIDNDGGEVTKVFRTKNYHWKLTNSTTMTFATTVKQFKEDVYTWKRHTLFSTHPNDFQCFLQLREEGRSLITPIPGLSTHCEPRWASPGINWNEV